MNTVSGTDAKAHLSRLLGLVRRGETILILHRCNPIARLERSGDLEPAEADQALATLERTREHGHEVQALSAVQTQARRLLRLHPLRTADALRLAAALVASELLPATLPFVALDRRLARAAMLEGSDFATGVAEHP